MSVDSYSAHRNEPDEESPSFLILVLMLLESPASAVVQEADRESTIRSGPLRPPVSDGGSELESKASSVGGTKASSIEASAAKTAIRRRVPLDTMGSRRRWVLTEYVVVGL